jgi:hypothetical protein
VKQWTVEERLEGCKGGVDERSNVAPDPEEGDAESLWKSEMASWKIVSQE